MKLILMLLSILITGRVRWRGMTFAFALIGASTSQAVTLQTGDLLAPTNGFFKTLVSVDPVTGNRTLVTGNGLGTGPVLSAPTSVTISPDRKVYLLDSGLNSLLGVDVATGNRTVISGMGIGAGTPFSEVSTVAFESPTSSLVTDNAAKSIIRVDLHSGDRTLLSGPGRGLGPLFLGHTQSIAIGHDGDVFMSESLYRINGEEL